MSTSVAAPHPTVATRQHLKWGWLAVAIAVALVVAFIPTPQGLSRTAQLVLAIICGTVVLWAAEVMNNGVASLLMMAILMVVGVPPLVVVPELARPSVSGALSGYSDGAWWTLLVVVYYGFVMKKSGLAERMSFCSLSLLPSTYAGIVSAFFLFGLVLSLGIPSMTV